MLTSPVVQRMASATTSLLLTALLGGLVVLPSHAQTYGALTTLTTFNGTSGNIPRSGVTLDSIGNIYGTTTQGGDSNVGTVYKIATGTNTLTTLSQLQVQL